SAATFTQSNARPASSQAADTQPTPARQAKPVVYTTPPKTAVAKLNSGEPNAHEIRGKVTFTLKAANNDDTVDGILVLTIPNEARKKIAQASGKPLNSIPAYVMKKDVVAGFQNGTACPIVSIEIGATELDVVGAKLSFNHIVADVIETH